MKKLILIANAVFAFSFANAQNTFPSSGNVGIGTNAPPSLLSLTSSYITDLRLNREPDKYARMLFTTGGTIDWYVGMDNDATPGQNSFTIQDQNGVKLIVNQGGNVGIGTTNPDEKLAVKGTIHANAIKVDLNVPGPDYVFKSDYKLSDLTEVKDYIDKNHHLTEIPSSCRNGVRRH